MSKPLQSAQDSVNDIIHNTHADIVLTAIYLAGGTKKTNVVK